MAAGAAFARNGLERRSPLRGVLAVLPRSLMGGDIFRAHSPNVSDFADSILSAVNSALHGKRVETVGQELTMSARALAGLGQCEHRSLAEPHPRLPAIAIVAQDL